MDGVRGRARLLTVGLLLGSVALAGCSGNPEKPTPTKKPSQIAQANRITFGVWGSEDATEPFKPVVETFNSLSDNADVTLRRYASHDDLMSEVRDGGSSAPDVFMIQRRDLAALAEQHKLRPVDDPLVERGMDFGDDYSRDAILALSADDHLLCMPYGISPMVIYYNTDLINFDKLQARGRPVPNVERTSWGLEAMQAAAKQASRPGKGSRGIYVPPSIAALAPFIYSGGGEVYNDTDNPTSLAFSGSASQAALERTLELLRNPHLTLSDKQLRKHTPLEWFERGKLAMMEGYRDLVPELRQVFGLDFDVIAMPSLGAQRTVGDITGLCIRQDTANPVAAADFVFHAVSDEQVGRVVRAGYLVPANLSIANSEEFLQPHRLPHHAEVFNTAARSIVVPPLVPDFSALEAAVADTLHEMLTMPVIEDLGALTAQIDAESRSVLAPTPTESPSGTESGTPSASSSAPGTPSGSTSPSG
jgi:multiple sugar transport system substrate-binding protein